MIDRILTGTATDEDIARAQAFEYEDRKKLQVKLLGALDVKFEEAILLEKALEDVVNALKQARPVFAAGLSTDQALGFIIKMVQESLDDLSETGADDTEEYEKQELVLQQLKEFVNACEQTGNTEGEEALETVHLEYRGQVAKLDELKRQAEDGIGNVLGFLQSTYGTDESDAFLKAMDHNRAAMRYIGTFGSKSFFAYKHVAAPGQKATDPVTDEAEVD